MKKLTALILVLVCTLGFLSCNNKSMNYIISNKPNITGVVKKANENAILIEVVVYYDGYVAESYPMQINNVYAITLKTPADRTENDEAKNTGGACPTCTNCLFI